MPYKLSISTTTASRRGGHKKITALLSICFTLQFSDAQESRYCDGNTTVSQLSSLPDDCIDQDIDQNGNMYRFFWGASCSDISSFNLNLCMHCNDPNYAPYSLNPAVMCCICSGGGR